MSAPQSLPTYLSCIYQLAYCPAPAHFLSPTTLSQILEEGLADISVPNRQEESALLLLAFILITTSPTQRRDA